MVIRSFSGRLRRGREADFYAVVRERIERFRREHELVESHVARRATDTGDRFMIITIWPDWDTLIDWIGPDPSRPWGSDELIPLMEEWHVEHFEEFAPPDQSPTIDASG